MRTNEGLPRRAEAAKKETAAEVKRLPSLDHCTSPVPIWGARGGSEPEQEERRREIVYFLPALNFAQRARCAAAILLRPAAEIFRFWGVAAGFAFAPCM